MDGFEASKIIKQRNKKTIIVALTASAFEETRVECEKVGIDDFITKPLTLQSLKEILQKWLSN